MKSKATDSAENEIQRGQRFAFGENWQKFLNEVSEEKIIDACNSLSAMMSVENLQGKTFLDVGCGSGLFSLAATRLGAKVTSFDYDPQSVACTNELKRRFCTVENEWQVLSGSVLDKEFLHSLGQFDIVYSWGVLHHTGNQMLALFNVDKCVKNDGILFIALYNYQKFASKYWLWIKKTYNKFRFLRGPLVIIHLIYPTIPSLIIKLLQGRKYPRGMSVRYDLYDWLGGYPFEVSKPEDIFHFYKALNYSLANIVTVGGRMGCNEYVFVKGRRSSQ